jgi:hypothetical protein
MEVDVQLVGDVCLRPGAGADPEALLAPLRARWEGRVGPSGWLLPGSLALRGCSEGECVASGEVVYRVAAAGRAVAAAPGAAVRLPVLMRGPWGAWLVGHGGGLWVFLPAATAAVAAPEGAADAAVVLGRVLARVGAPQLFALGAART